MVNMQMSAAKQAATQFESIPLSETRMLNVNVEGYVFSVTRDAKSGKITNAFPIIPNAPKPSVPPNYNPSK